MVASRPAQLPGRNLGKSLSAFGFRRPCSSPPPSPLFLVVGGASFGEAWSSSSECSLVSPSELRLVFRRKLPLASEPTDPCTTDVGTGTASTSVLKLPLGGSREGPAIKSNNFRLSTCYCSQDQLRSERSAPGASQSSVVASVRTLLHVARVFCSAGKTTSDGTRSERQGLGVIHFRGRSLRQVGCYTFHSGCRPSWPPPNSEERATAFRGSVDEREPFRPLTRAFGFLRVASTAYQ